MVRAVFVTDKGVFRCWGRITESSIWRLLQSSLYPCRGLVCDGFRSMYNAGRGSINRQGSHVVLLFL